MERKNKGINLPFEIIPLYVSIMNGNRLLQDIYFFYPTASEKDTLDCEKKLACRTNKIKYKKPLKENDFYDEIQRIAHGFAVVDWTDMNSCCYELKILLHKNQEVLDDDVELMSALNGTRYDLRVFISVLHPYYFLFIEETRYIEALDKWLFNSKSVSSIEGNRLSKEICSYLSQRGYFEITNIIAKEIVPDVQTELKDVGQATVFDCLFTDIMDVGLV